MKNFILCLLFSSLTFVTVHGQENKKYGTHGFYIGNEVTINSLERSGYQYEIKSGEVPQNKNEVLKQLSVTIVPAKDESIDINIDYDGEIIFISYGYSRKNPKAMSALFNDLSIEYGDPNIITSKKTYFLARWDCEKPLKNIEVIAVGFAGTYNDKVTDWSIIVKYCRCLN